MPQFDDDACKRITNVVKRFESDYDDQTDVTRRIFPVSTKLRLAWATTSVAVATGDASFTVSKTSVAPFDGSTWTAGDGVSSLFVSNKPDAYKISSGVTGKIVYCYCAADTNTPHNYDGTTTNAPTGWNWHPLDFPWPC